MMMRITRLNHIGIRSLDRARTEQFYVGVLGLKPHPTKTNWLRTEDGELDVHIMPGTDRSNDGNDHADLARHLALETNDLEGVVDDLIAAGLKPFQSDITGKNLKDLSDSSDLSYGIGTVFVWDPDNNLVEFVDKKRGILAQVLGQGI